MSLPKNSRFFSRKRNDAVRHSVLRSENLEERCLLAVSAVWENAGLEVSGLGESVSAVMTAAVPENFNPVPVSVSSADRYEGEEINSSSPLVTSKAEAPSTVVTTLYDVVNRSDGLISLREAISYADEGDTITFDSSLTGGTILLNGKELTIEKSVVIDASGAEGMTIDAGGQSRCFIIDGSDSEMSVQFVQLTITGGTTEGSGGGISAVNASLELADTVLNGNYAGDIGSALFFEGAGCTLTMTGCAVIDNGFISGESYLACALSFMGEKAVLTDTVISDNDGRGIYTQSEMHLAECTISGNSCGGIIGSAGDSGFIISDSVISNNYSPSEGGGIFFSSASFFRMKNCTVTQNESQLGGGIAVYAPEITISDSVFSDNSAAEGGGLFIMGTFASLTSVFVSDNYVSGEGGGIFWSGEYLVMTHCTVGNNNAAHFGGGLFLGGTSADLINVLISDNSAADETSMGGGIFWSGENLSFYNSTVAGNSAPIGGGVYACGGIFLYNSIAAENSSCDIICDEDASFPRSAYFSLSSYTGWTESESVLLYDASKPLFTDAAEGNYTLTDDTQVFNAGKNDYVITETDLAGSPRIIGDNVEMGAYESLRITKKLPAPTGLHAKSVGYDAVSLSWNKVQNAAGYELAYSVNGNPFETVQYIDTSVLFYISDGNRYQFKVKALGEDQYSDSLYSEEISFAAGGKGADLLPVTVTAVDKYTRETIDILNGGMLASNVAEVTITFKNDSLDSTALQSFYNAVRVKNTDTGKYVVNTDGSWYERYYSGGILDAGAEGEIGFLMPRLSSGNYALEVFVDSRGRVAESNELNNQETFYFTVEGDPDLVPVSISATDKYTKEPIDILYGKMLTDNTAQVTVKFKNAGIDSTSVKAFYNTVRVRNTDTGEYVIGADDTWYERFYNGGILNAGETGDFSFLMPKLDAGHYEIEVMLDSRGVVEEDNELNNYAVFSFEVIGKADLNPVTITAADKYTKEAIDILGGDLANTNTAVITVAFQNSGDSVTRAGKFYNAVRLKNLTTGKYIINTNGSWYESFYSGGVITSGETASYAFAMPRLTAGKYLLEVKIDNRNMVSEQDETNNTVQYTFTVKNAKPDLTVSGVTAVDKYSHKKVDILGGKTTAANTLQITVSFKNIGESGTETAKFYNAVRVKNTKTGKYIAGSSSKWYEVYYSGGKVSSGGTGTFTFLLPRLAVGTYSLEIEIDNRNVIAESDENNNIQTYTFTVSRYTGVLSQELFDVFSDDEFVDGLGIESLNEVF